MTDDPTGSGPVLPPSRFGAGYSVGGPEAQPSYQYPAFAAPEPPAPEPPPPFYPAAIPPPPLVQYPAAVPYPVVMPVTYVQARRTNGMAIAALVCPLVFCVLFPLGIIFGHIALSQIARTGDDGKGLAIAGLVISYLTAAFVLFAFLLPALRAVI